MNDLDCTICLEHLMFGGPFGEGKEPTVRTAVTIQEGNAVCVPHVIAFANWDRRIARHISPAGTT